ncbi:MAG: inorganic diphosphatase [Candidatus Xenobiia bacterium LiM19]
MVHPWHGVKIGSGSPEICNVIIEIPEGSKNKYELDKPTGLLRLDRVLSASMRFPVNYGFFPQTYFHDGDPLDVLVLSQEPIEPLTLVKVRVIGYLLVVDRGDRDTKIIAVPMKDPQFSHYTDISQIHENVIAEIKHFFEQYKKLEGKVVTAEKTGGPAEACEMIREGMNLYEKNRHKLIPLNDSEKVKE